MKTQRLFLDEALNLGVAGSANESYPPLSVEERRVLKIIAENLFLSQSSLCWAFYEAQHGGSDGFKRIRDKLLSPLVKMVVK